MKGAAKTALEQNSQFVKCIVKVGIKQMARNHVAILVV